MSVSEYLNKHLSTVADTFPTVAPMETDMPYIVYTLEPSEETKTITGAGYTENFVTINLYHKEYDKAEELKIRVQEVLNCSAENNIMGATFTSSGNGYNPEPKEQFTVELQYSVYER